MKSKDFTVKDFKDFNFKYYTEVDYESVRNCSNRGCDGICRCSTLENVRVDKAPDIQFVVNVLFRYKNKSEVLAYCLDRLFRLYKMDDAESFTAHTTNGYYGEEIGEVEFHAKELVAKKIDELLKIPDKEKLEFILVEEYGAILPKMVGLKYSIKEVDTDDVKLPNRDYLTKINHEKVENYSSQTDDYPICVCMKEGNFYTLLDGYHRLTAWKKSKHKKVKIFSGE